VQGHCVCVVGWKHVRSLVPSLPAAMSQRTPLVENTYFILVLPCMKLHWPGQSIDAFFAEDLTNTKQATTTLVHLTHTY
jgi:hypothetical protein